MRFELRYKKMEVLNKLGIHTLEDLKDIKKIKSLEPLLLKAWEDTLIYSHSINLNDAHLSLQDERLVNNDGQHYKYWLQLKQKSNSCYYYQRNKFKELVSKYGEGEHQFIGRQLQKEWQELFACSSPN